MNSEITILGGGLSGLSTGWKLAELGHVVTVLEKEKILGGLSSTFEHGEYRLDIGPHKIYTQLDVVLDDIKGLIGDDLLEHPKKSSVRLKGNNFTYPVNIKELLLKLNPILGFKLGLSYFVTTFTNKIRTPKDITYEDYIINRFGKEIYNLVFEPIARKTWGDPTKLSAELAKARVSIPNLLEMFKRVIFGDKDEKEISAKVIYYPKNGIIMLSEKMGERITDNNGTVNLNSKAISVEHENSRIMKVIYSENENETEISTDHLVSTIPINDLVTLMSPRAPEEVISAAKGLKYRALIVMYLFVKRNRIIEDQFIFYPEKEFIFNRLSEQKGFSESMAPADKAPLMVEFTCDYQDALWNLGDEDLFKKTLKDLEKAEILKSEEVDEYFVLRLKRVYPVYDLDFRKNLDTIFGYLDRFDNLLTIGRQGLFNYNNMDHCIDMGIFTANHIHNKGNLDEWRDIRKRFNEYQIVD